MKRFLRAVLSKRQQEKLSAIKGKIYSFFEHVFVFIIKRFPDKILLIVKSKIMIIRKMDYKRNDILLNIDSDIENNVRLHSCKKEPETVEWIHTFFKENEVFYDIGANVGAYSLVASKFLNGKIKIYAFEPSFITFAQLCKNIYINNCHESIAPLQIALSDKTNIDIFNYNNLTPGGALHTLGDPIDYRGDVFAPIFKQSALAYRIDDIIKQFHLPIPNHIKIDVDGIEFKILEGAEETLQNQLVRSLILELEEGDEANRIINFLALKGFRIHSKYKHKDV